MESNWEQAIKFILKWEGGYVNDPDDPGGETKYGISKRAYPHVDIPNLTLESAREIYHKDYWVRAGCDILQYPLDIIVFDTAVNMGVKTANTLLANCKDDWRTYLLDRIGLYTTLKTARIYVFGWVRRVLNLYKEVQ